MAITVQIPPPLREQAGGRLDVPVAGGTVKACLADLVAQCPGLQGKLFDAAGTLRTHINILVNDEDVRYLDDLDTTVTDGQVVVLMPAVSGG